MISAVLDTNVLASGTVSSQNAPGQILNAWRSGQFMLVTSEHIISELEHVFQKPYFQKYISNDQINGFIDLLRNEALVTPIAANISGVAVHPEDDLILAAAVSVKTNYLVTGDQPLLNKVGKVYRKIRLLTPNEFLKEVTF